MRKMGRHDGGLRHERPSRNVGRRHGLPRRSRNSRRDTREARRGRARLSAHPRLAARRGARVGARPLRLGVRPRGGKLGLRRSRWALLRDDGADEARRPDNHPDAGLHALLQDGARGRTHNRRKSARLQKRPLRDEPRGARKPRHADLPHAHPVQPAQPRLARMEPRRARSACRHRAPQGHDSHRRRNPPGPRLQRREAHLPRLAARNGQARPHLHSAEQDIQHRGAQVIRRDNPRRAAARRLRLRA